MLVRPQETVPQLVAKTLANILLPFGQRAEWIMCLASVQHDHASVSELSHCTADVRRRTRDDSVLESN
ncbi:uncharacterized [Tachysurus ichikawai]